MHQENIENSMDYANDHRASLHYGWAGAKSELLDHIKSRKLRYFGHVTRLPHDNIESSDDGLVT